MVDEELNETENRNLPEDEPGQSEAFKARVAELQTAQEGQGLSSKDTRILELEQVAASLEGEIAQKDQELVSRDTCVAELEQMVASLESEIATLKQSLAESNDALNKLNESLSQTVASYKTLVIQSHPDVPEELITGDSVEAINNSLASAKELVSKVRKGVEAEISLVRVPAGAPERTAPDLSALSPREKIQYAIGGKR